MKYIKNMFKKGCTRSHPGKPTTAGCAWATPDKGFNRWDLTQSLGDSDQAD
jgi:hypothetical protein